MKTYPVCKTCGSEDVRANADVMWNKDTQQWEVVAVYQNTDCEKCESDCHIEWKEVKQ